MPANRLSNKDAPALQSYDAGNSQTGACPFKQGWKCNKTMPEGLTMDVMYLYCIACQLAQVTTELYKLR